VIEILTITPNRPGATGLVCPADICSLRAGYGSAAHAVRAHPVAHSTRQKRKFTPSPVLSMIRLRPRPSSRFLSAKEGRNQSRLGMTPLESLLCLGGVSMLPLCIDLNQGGKESANSANRGDPSW
jgi:hypothetical protein